MKKVYNFTNIASHYRKNLWEKLLNSEEFEFHLFFGKNKWLNIKEINFNTEIFRNNQRKLHKIKNYWVKGNILIWQSKVISNCLKGEINTAIFLGEFQVISTWIAVIICKIRGIQVVYWTHGLYGNESFWKKKLRVLFYKTADKLLLYGNRSKQLLINEGIGKDKIEVIYNSLDYDSHLKIRNKLKKTNIYSNHFKNSHPTIIFIGRLTKIKKLDLLIKAQQKLKEKGTNLNVVFIGKGTVKKELEKYIFENRLEKNYWFYGACYDEKIIGELSFNADLCVSPGNVGLTAIHCLTYGTPVITHNNFSNQMPEIEAIEEDISGCFFSENDVEDLSKSIKKWINKKESRNDIRNNCYKIIDKYYNPYYQIKILKSIIG